MTIGDTITVRCTDDTNRQGIVTHVPTHGRFVCASYEGKNGDKIPTTVPLYNGQAWKERKSRIAVYGRAKVTTEMCEEMQRLRAQGMTYEKIGNKLGVQSSTVRKRIKEMNAGCLG